MADYTSTGIIHNTSVDFTRRVISEPVHIVQGDRTLPTLAVELLADGQPYTVPDGAQVNIALNKKDGTFVLNKADSVDGNIATFTITAQMAAVSGDFTPEVQIVNGAGQATTGKFPYIVDKAEIQEGMIESTSEGTALISYVDKAEAAADRAQEAADKADTVVINTEAAEKAATDAAASATAAATSEKNAADSATAAADSATASANSATAAKASEDAAAKTLTDIGTAKEEAVSAIGDAKTEALTAVATDKDAAAKSATDAADSATLARSYARGDTATRDGEDTDNAKYYMEQAQKAALGNLDDKMSDTSENAVKNMVIKAYVDSHVPDLSDATTEASGLMSAEDKAKLDGIAEGATKDDLTPYAKTADVNTSLDGKQDKGDYATADDLAKKGDTLSYADSTLKLLSGETVLSEVTIEGGAASIQVKVTFDEAFKGAEYSITGGDESYTGTVPDGLVVIQKVKSYNTTYTVKSTANSQEYTSTVATGQYAGEYATVLNTFTATIQVTVTASAAAASGATVKAKSGANEYTATTNASGVAEVKVHNTGEYSITATYGDYNEGTGDSVTISTDGESVSSSVALFGAVLKVTADISSATATDASKVTVSDGTHNFEKTITATSTFSFTIYNAGTYKINMTNGTDTAAEVSVDVLEDGTEYPANVSYLKIVTWADGTDEEVAAMVAAADKGAIKLSDYWGVGDERKVKLSAMAATGVGETQAVQEVTMVLMNVGGVTLQNGKECNFVVGQKNGLATYGYMNSSRTNSGSWGNCARRKWCNEVYFKALPEYFQNMLKMMETKTPLAEGAGAEVQTVEDMIALPASAQVWKDDATATASRGDRYSYCAREDFNIGLEQWEWFKTPANRVKKLGDTGSAYAWWERSPSSNPSGVGQCFCCVSTDGIADAHTAAVLLGLAPFGCI